MNNVRLLTAIITLIASTTLFAYLASAADPIRITTPRGAPIAIIAEKPAGKGPFPAVVLASGSGYHMRQPVLAETAAALLAQGVAVYRLDWAYRVAGSDFFKQPKDRLAEIEDLNTALALARKDPDIDKSRIAVAGKSLGSIIAWRVLRNDPDLRGALLLTPVCARPNEPEAAVANYPAIADEKRPLLWLLGDADAACPTATLYRFVADTGASTDASIVVIDGDHGFEAPQYSERNIALAARIAADFASRLLDQQPRTAASTH